MSTLLLLAGAFTNHQVTNGSTGVQLELWQVINLLGAPALAVLFARPVVDDLVAWLRSRHTDDR
jgi:hypothetical protein